MMNSKRFNQILVVVFAVIALLLTVQTLTTPAETPAQQCWCFGQ